jgi:hypothetical protein
MVPPSDPSLEEIECQALTPCEIRRGAKPRLQTEWWLSERAAINPLNGKGTGK